MNRRFVVFAAACLAVFLPCTSISAQQARPDAMQAKPAAATAAPAAPAKWIPPIKGQATVDFIQAKPTKVKGEVLTKMKVKNTSKGSIALLTVEEIWYDNKSQIASNGRHLHRALLNPGEVVEFTLASEDKPNLYQNMLSFKHANGPIKPTRVTKFN
jgi:hypothetical protein